MNARLLVQALASSKLFGGLGQDSLEAIIPKVKFRQYFPGEVIVWEGRSSDSIFLIVNGIVEVRKMIKANEHRTLAYLLPGNTFGEVGILDNHPRSASVVALVDVDAVVIRREDFLDMAQSYPIIAISLAKVLGQYLIDTNRRLSRGNNKSKLILILNMFKSLGATSLGMLLSQVISENTSTTTVYTEYPEPAHLIVDLDIDKRSKIFHHPAGYDVMVSAEESHLPVAARTTLMVDSLMNTYNNIIITINEAFGEGSQIDENLALMLDNASQVVVVAPPHPTEWKHVLKVQNELKKFVRPNAANTFVLINQATQENVQILPEAVPDFIIPHIPNFPKVAATKKKIEPIPAPLDMILSTLVNSLERTHQIAVYVPSTIGVDGHSDTQAFQEKTLNFMASKFGGATAKEARGVWNSQEVGLVGEKVILVHSYLTQNDLTQHIDSVIDFVRTLKVEMQQEAMALEVDGKLTLL
jgi:CRP-like cAMP-binding protein